MEVRKKEKYKISKYMQDDNNCYKKIKEGKGIKVTGAGLHSQERSSEKVIFGIYQRYFSRDTEKVS